MRIVITDSGLGGLSVAADLFERLKEKKINGVEIIFANALPETGKGYNKMPDKATKVSVFNTALKGFYDRFKPKTLSVACNTLSVLLESTEFDVTHKNIISDIVKSGVRGFLDTKVIDQNDNLVIFATETTIESKVHEQEFSSIFNKEQICPIPCSGLASAIENDFNGLKTKQLIREAVSQITCKGNDNKTFAYLACTHYGYVKDEFFQQMTRQGINNMEVVDPNQYLVDQLFYSLDKIPQSEIPSNIKVVSRCQILDTEVESISQLIQSTSNDTVKALRNYSVIPDLF